MAQRRDIQHEKPELALKIATRDLIGTVGGTDGAAATLSRGDRRVRQQRMSDVQHPNTEDFLHLHEIGRLEDVAIRTPAWPHVTRALADRHGFDLVRRPDALPTDIDWCGAIAAAVKEFGEAQQAILTALPDGVTGREVRDSDIRGQIADAIRALCQLDALAERAIELDSS